MAEGGILEGEEVIREILEEEEVIREIREEEEEAREEIHPATTSWRDNNQLFSKETDGSRKHSCKNGTYIEASIGIPRK